MFSDFLFMFLAIAFSIITLSILFVLTLRPALLLYTVPLLLSVEYRLELGFASFALAELSAVLVWIVSLLRIRRRHRILLKRNEVVLLIFIMIVALPSIFFERDARHALSVYRDFTIPLIFFAGFMSAGLSRQQTIKLIKVFVLLATVSAILAILQFRTGNYMWTMRPEDRFWQDFKTGFIRSSAVGQLFGVEDTLPVGLYSTTNNFASFLVIPTVLAFALAILPSRSRSERLLWKASFVALFAGLLLTFSRSSLITFLAAWLFLMIFRRKDRVSSYRFAVFGGAVLLLSGLMLGSGILSWDQLGTLQGRMSMFQAGLKLLNEHPEALLTGGFTEDYLARYYQEQLIHNLPLYMALQFSFLAALAWLLLVIIKLRYILGVIHSRDKEMGFLGLALFGGVFATVFIYAQTTSFADSVQSSLWLFFWMGIGSYLSYFHKHETLVCKEGSGKLTEV